MTRRLNFGSNSFNCNHLSGLFVFFASLFACFLFSNSAHAVVTNGGADFIYISSSGNASFGKVNPSSSGSIATAQDTLSISTNCSAGFNIYISAVNDSATGTSLINNTANSNNEISTLSGTTIGSTALALQDNTWGFNTVNNNTYYGLPTHANAMDHAIYSGTGGSIPIYYGAKVTNALVPGKYTGEVLYTATVNSSCLFYTVSFDKNAVDATGSMNSQSIPPSTATPLTTNAFERPGYVFLGWSTDQNATTPTYTDGQSVTNLAASGGSITLYAVWGQTMQSWAEEGLFNCAKLSENQIITLLDTRDGNEYAIKKLKDGKCWMVQNLRLQNYKLTAADSDVTSDFDLTTGVVYSRSSGWCSEISQSCQDVKAVYYNSSKPNYGAYYNWYTAIAGSIPSSVNSGNATASICPKGWKLPTYDNLSSLNIALGGSSVSDTSTRSTWLGDYTSGNNVGIAKSGSIYGSLSTTGSGGGIYASTAGPSNAVAMWFDSSNTVSAGTVHRYSGRAVRCVAKTANATGYMQDFNSSSLATNSTTILADKRDYSEYTVKKFSDGNVWMISNLRLGYDKGYALTKDLTNISSSDNGTYYIPKAGYQGSMSSSSTVNSTTTANFNETDDKISRLQYVTTASGISENTGYYNFYTATLGCSGGYFFSGTCNSGYVQRDICPKGWQLPTGDTGVKSWYKFYYNNFGSYSSIVSGANLSFTGFFTGTGLTRSNSDGFWRSSTGTNLRIYSTNNITPQSSDYMSMGFAVRCVASS